MPVPVSRSTSEPPRDAAESDADPVAVARSICLRLLAAAPRTRAQLATRLQRRGVPDEIADTVLDRFSELQLIDDAAYAAAFVAARTGSRVSGRRGIAAELQRRGVDREVVVAALDPLDGPAEEQAALRFAAARAPRFAGLPREVARRRLAGALARRGFPGAMVARVVEVALSGGVPGQNLSPKPKAIGESEVVTG